MERRTGKFTMAHTDKTDPFWVRMESGYYPHAEVHDHRLRPCNIDQFRWSDPGLRDKCYKTFVYDGRNVCACVMCHGWYSWDGPTARSERHQTKKVVARWRDEFNAYSDIEAW